MSNFYTLKELSAAGFNPAAIPGIALTGAEVGQIFRRFSDRRYAYSADSVQEAVTDIGQTWDLFLKAHSGAFDKLISAFTTEYKPLENYSMTEKGTDTTDRKHELSGSNNRTGTTKDTGTDTTARTSTTTDTGTDTTAHTGTVTNTGTDTAKTADTTTQTTKNTGTVKEDVSDIKTASVSAYDSADYSPTSKDTTAGANTRTDDTQSVQTNGGELNTNATTSGTVTNDLTDTKTLNLSKAENATDTKTLDLTRSETFDDTKTESQTDSGTDTHSLSRSGNIGVTTSQQMLSSEIFLRVRNNTINYIVELFVSQYTIW